MPKRAKGAATKKSGRPRRTKDEVQAILDKIDSLRAQGKSIAAALKEVGVPYTNYNYWTKKQGQQSGAASGRKSGISIVSAGQLTGKSVQMQAVLNEIQQARAAGESLDSAIKAKGLTVSNYYYWVKTLAKKGSVIVKGGSVGAVGKHTGGTVAVLDAMRRNREQKDHLVRQAEALDNEFNALLRKLGSA